MRAATASVDLAAISANVKALAAFAKPAKFCAVVKANAYGHGAVNVAQAALAGGADELAVALVQEGVELREAGITAPIHILSQPRPFEMPSVVVYDLSPGIYSIEGLASLSGALSRASITSTDSCVKVHLNFDTGMNRVGFREPDQYCELSSVLSICCSPVGLSDLLTLIDADPRICLDGVLTHFACADDPSSDFTDRQLEEFDAALDRLKAIIGDDRFSKLQKHCANSAAFLTRSDTHMDLVRCGLAIYGISPLAATAGSELPVELTPALSLRTRISHMKCLNAGETVSYGRQYRAEATSALATIPIGYADGWRRDSGFRGLEVLIHGVRCPIVGAVTMDQTMVDVTGAALEGASVCVGDEVVLIGEQNGSVITVDEVAKRLDTIPYEVLCSIGSRVERCYEA